MYWRGEVNANLPSRFFIVKILQNSRCRGIFLYYGVVYIDIAALVLIEDDGVDFTVV